MHRFHPITFHLSCSSFPQSQWQKRSWCAARESSFPLEGRGWGRHDVVSQLFTQAALIFSVPLISSLFSENVWLQKELFSESKSSLCLVTKISCRWVSAVFYITLILFQGKRACQEVLWQAVQGVLHSWPQQIQRKQGGMNGRNDLNRNAAAAGVQ